MALKIKIERTIQQKTSEWLELKRGKTSGSLIKPIFTSKSKAPWKTYAYKLIAQEENKEPMVYRETYLSAAVEWGNTMEPLALEEFTKQTGILTENVAWVESLNPKLVGRSGCSPDAICDIYRWLEVKCLETANHVRYVSENKLPIEFKPQILNYFLINPDLKVVYFTLYDPRIKPSLHVIPVLRTDHEVEIEDAYTKLLEFHELKDELHKKYKEVTRPRQKSVLQIEKKTLETIQEFNNLKEAAKYHKCTPAAIRNACNGKSKTSKGFKWRFNYFS